jgi:AcrR family transcriptional regulator
MDMRTEMLKAAEALLLESSEYDISTRAVCEAVGVGAPVLYRLFGDKNGLLAAVVDRVFERYVVSKRSQRASDDPVIDLYSAWDLHIAFALKNQIVYRIAYAPSLNEVPDGVEQARQLLLARLVRCAEGGSLTTSPEAAAQIMTTACTGVAISLISQPAIFRYPALSQQVRDAVLAQLVVQTVPADGRRDTSSTVALQMAALIRANPTPLTRPEAALMLQWLDSITSAADNPKPTRATTTTQKSTRGRAGR